MKNLDNKVIREWWERPALTLGIFLGVFALLLLLAGCAPPFFPKRWPGS